MNSWRFTAMNAAVLAALAAAALFGASTPFAKALVGEQSPLLIAGLLYLGSGVGLTLVRLVRDRGWTFPSMTRGEWTWLFAAIAFGGALGPALLMIGLGVILVSVQFEALPNQIQNPNN